MPIQIPLLCVLPIHVEMHTRVGLPVRNNYLHDEARVCEVFDKNFTRLGDLQLPFFFLHIVILIVFTSMACSFDKRMICGENSDTKKNISDGYERNSNAVKNARHFGAIAMITTLRQICQPTSQRP